MSDPAVLPAARASSGLQKSKVRVSVVKAPSGNWRITVTLPNGAHAVSEHPCWDGAWERRYELHELLTQNLPPVRGDAMHGPMGRESAA